MSLSICSKYKSPNYNLRNSLNIIDTIILHYTGMDSEKTALNYLCNEKSEVSAH